MMRRNLMLCVALAVLTARASVVRADDAPFPFDSVDRNTFTVGFIDLSRLTSATLGESAKVIVGEEAATEVAGPLVLFVLHKAGADRQALTEAAKGFNLGEATYTAAGERWMRVEPAEQKTEPGLDHATRTAIAAELAAIDAAAAGYAMVMTPAFRAMLSGELKKMEQRAAVGRPADGPNVEAMMLDLLRSVLAMKSGHVAVTLGAQPSYRSTLRAVDAEAAGRVVAAFDKMRTGLEKAAKEQGAGVTEITMLGQMLGLMQPRAIGADVVMNIETEQLRTFGQNVLLPAMKQAREAARQAMLMNNMRQVLVAMVNYAIENDDKYPDTLEQLAKYLGDDPAAILTHPLTGEKPAFEYVKPAARMADVKDTSTTPVLYELRNGKRHDQGAVGYADSHVVRQPSHSRESESTTTPPD